MTIAKEAGDSVVRAAHAQDEFYTLFEKRICEVEKRLSLIDEILNIKRRISEDGRFIGYHTRPE